MESICEMQREKKTLRIKVSDSNRSHRDELQ